MPQDDQIMNFPMDTDRNRYDKPVWNQLELTGMTGPEPMNVLQRDLSTVTEVGRAQIVLTEPSRCQATDVKLEGTVSEWRWTAVGRKTKTDPEEGVCLPGQQ